MIKQLGYLGFEVKDLAAWERFSTQVLGLGVARRHDHGFALRMDSHAARFFVEEGGADDVSVLGLQVEDEATLRQAASRVRAAGIEVTDGTPEEAARRGVAALVRYRDPGGMPSEIFFGPEKAPEPFRSEVVRSGFVAEELGFGHLVLSAPDMKASRGFYEDVLGFRYSDRITAEIHGHHADLLFFHTNGRHHSIAIGGPQRKRIHHFLVEVRAMDDVGLAFDRALRGGIRIFQTIGRHPNDKMFSFYARTPSGFQFEYGAGGRVVDDATWQPGFYDCISEWGHHPPEFLVPKKDGARP